MVSRAANRRAKRQRLDRRGEDPAVTGHPGVPAPLRIVVADDQASVREGLVVLPGTVPEIEVVASAANGEEAIRLVAEKSPDAILLDLHMPVLDGIEATRRLSRQHPGVAVVVLTTYADDSSVPRCRPTRGAPPCAAWRVSIPQCSASRSAGSVTDEGGSAGLGGDARDRGAEGSEGGGLIVGGPAGVPVRPQEDRNGGRAVGARGADVARL
jgi:CheY-like chemotaxis protein